MSRKSALRKTLLLTGFEPFGGESCNPSWDAVQRLDGARIGGHRVIARALPVVFGASLKTLRAALREAVPAVTICVGQAGGRAQVSLERIAINIDDARIPDNAGHQPVDTAIIADGPAAYFSTLPIKAIHAELQEAGLPSHVSQSAGTYVCNHVFYGLMHALRQRRHARGGFIHIPYAPAQAACHSDAPSMPTDAIVEALRIALRTSLHTREDIPIAAGSEH